MLDVLTLQLTVAAGREVDAARHLADRIRGSHWAILVALAAELLTEHERRQAGSAVVLVSGAAQAERVLQDLEKATRP